MNSPIQIFDEWLRLCGPKTRFHPIPAEIADPFTLQLERFKRGMEEIRSMFLANRSIEVYLDYIDDGSCNATAGFYKWIGLIGMNRGAILLPLEMFYKMLSHPLVWLRAGDPKKERRCGRHNEGMPRNYDDLIRGRSLLRSKTLPQPPVDSNRKTIAEYCAEYVWGFLIFHELVHILHGHLHYLQRASSIPAALQVLQSPAPLSIDDLDYQSVELWADSKAVAVGIRGLLKTTDPVLNSLFPTPDAKLFMWSFAIHSLFRLWGLPIDPKDLAGHTHPPTLLRLELAISAASIEIENEFPQHKDCFWKAIRGAQREVEKAFVYCGANPITTEDVIGSRDQLVTDHCNALLDHHQNVLVPELRKYTHLSLDANAVPVT